MSGKTVLKKMGNGKKKKWQFRSVVWAFFFFLLLLSFFITIQSMSPPLASDDPVQIRRPTFSRQFTAMRRRNGRIKLQQGQGAAAEIQVPLTFVITTAVMVSAALRESPIVHPHFRLLLLSSSNQVQSGHRLCAQSFSSTGPTQLLHQTGLSLNGLYPLVAVLQQTAVCLL